MEATPKVGLTVDTGKKGKPCLAFWEELRTPQPHPSRRSYHASAVWRDKMLVVGGQDLCEGSQAGVWALSFPQSAMERWERLPLPDLGALYRCSAIVFQDFLVVFGGTNGVQESSRVLKVNLLTLKLTQVETNSNDCPPPLDSHTASLYNTQMIIFGGFHLNDRSDNVFSFDLLTDEWRKLVTSSGPSPRSNHSASVFQSCLYVFGGSTDTLEWSNELWRLHLETLQWELVPVNGTEPSPRSGHTAVVYEDLMVVFGGMNGITRETNELFTFDFKANEWILSQAEYQIQDPVSYQHVLNFRKSTIEPQSGSPRRVRRLMSTATSTNSPIHRTGSRIATLSPGELSPIKKHRRERSLYDGPPVPVMGRVRGSAPHPRDGHSAVLIDSRMVIFGGDRHQVSFNDVYSYSLNSVALRTSAV